ncbi:MAG: cyclic nucleotide-binding domain-containing protein [Deltaproteobacteria bacterium]|nr:cyclic nucleotide-binding domain-containing protein [Deltaproteobacteria bacterium]
MSGKVVLRGGLKFTSLADLFQIIGGNNSTGMLRINTQNTPDPGIIYFVSGNPVNASEGDLQGLEAIYALFGRTDGDFEFTEGTVSVEQVIRKGRMEIVLDALRMIDDGVIKKDMPQDTQETPIEQPDKGMGTKKQGAFVIKGPVVDYFYILDEEQFSDGKTIVKEGTHGKWIWVLLEGIVKVSKETRKGPLPILHLGEGCYIGTFTSLLFHDYARSASVSALGDVRLGLLDTQRLAGEFYTLPNEFRGMLASLDRRLKNTTNRAVDLALKKKGFSLPPKGLEIVIPSGSKKREAYIITEGTAYLIRKTPDGHFPLLELEKNDFFGSVPFMDSNQEPKSAAVVAKNDLKVRKLNIPELKTAHDGLSTTFKGMISNICTCISYTTNLAELFSRKK